MTKRDRKLLTAFLRKYFQIEKDEIMEEDGMYHYFDHGRNLSGCTLFTDCNWKKDRNFDSEKDDR